MVAQTKRVVIHSDTRNYKLLSYIVKVNILFKLILEARASLTFSYTEYKNNSKK